MKTTIYKLEITDKTGQFELDMSAIENLINKNIPQSYTASITEIKE